MTRVAHRDFPRLPCTGDWMQGALISPRWSGTAENRVVCTILGVASDLAMIGLSVMDGTPKRTIEGSEKTMLYLWDCNGDDDGYQSEWTEDVQKSESPAAQSFMQNARHE
jgi:hypothetical protein